MTATPSSLLRLPRSSTRVAAVDLQHSRRRSAAIFGPAEVPDRQTAIRRLQAMVDAGPAMRLCLEPSTTSRRWGRAATGIAESVVDVPGSPDDPIAILDHVRRLPESGVRVGLSGDHVAIDFSHGLGDTAFCEAVADILVGAVSVDDPRWDRYRHRIPPLPLAAAATFGSDPRRLWRLGGLHRRRPRPETSDSVAAVDPGSGHSSPVLRIAPTARSVRVDAEDVARFRALRDQYLPGVGMFAIYTVALIEALDAAGVPLNPAVTIPFDVRPYLPRGVDTLATFSAGLAVPITTATSPAELQSLLAESAATGRPVANLLISSAKIRLASRARLAADAWEVPDAGEVRADLLHSFIGRVPHSDAIIWKDPSRAVNHTVSDPISPRGVTVTSAMIGDGALCMTAAFHPEHLDAQSIEKALTSIPTTIDDVVAGKHPAQ